MASAKLASLRDAQLAQPQFHAEGGFLRSAALADLTNTAAHCTTLTSTEEFALLASVVLSISTFAAAGRANKRVASAGGLAASCSARCRRQPIWQSGPPGSERSGIRFGYPACLTQLAHLVGVNC